jgi:hypothetical protein
MNSTLPETYDRDTLHMIARDPSTLYLYWELSAGKKRMAESHFERPWDGLTKRIRLYEAARMPFNGANARQIWEWPITRGTACYFHHANAARRYVADLGVTGTGGEFLPMMRSNLVATPEARGSGDKQLRDGWRNGQNSEQDLAQSQESDGERSHRPGSSQEFTVRQPSLSRIGGGYSVMSQVDGVIFCNYIDLSSDIAAGSGNGLPVGFEHYSAYTLYPATKVKQ